MTEWLERLTPVQKINGFEKSSPKMIGMLAHCPLSSKWVPGGNTVELEAAKSGPSYPASLYRLPKINVLSVRHSPFLWNRIWD